MSDLAEAKELITYTEALLLEKIMQLEQMGLSAAGVEIDRVDASTADKPHITKVVDVRLRAEL